jgi:hypothetical protein
MNTTADLKAYVLFLFPHNVRNECSVFGTIAALLHESRPSVAFSWCSAVTSGASPFAVLYTGDRDQAVEAFVDCLPKINSLLRDVYVDDTRHDMYATPYKPLAETDVQPPGHLTLAQTFSMLYRSGGKDIK